MKILFIINPVAGNKKAGKIWNEIRDKIFKEIGEQDSIFTKYPGNATEIAKKYSKDYDLIVSCGGDGTLNEIVNGLDNSSYFTILPLGTGSDFGKTIGIRDYKDLISSIKNGRIMEIDVPKVKYQGMERYFSNILEIGFGAYVMEYVNTHKSLGKYSFLSAIFAQLLKLKKFNVEMDGKIFETIEIIVANGKYFGGGMLASPNSILNDGKIDVHIVKAVSKLKTVFQLRDLISGKYIEKGYSFDFSGDHFIFKNENILFEMDGEVIGKTPIEVSIGKKLNLMLPK